MAQFVQLQQYQQDFQDAAIGIVALTYDAPELQQAFIDKNGIAYPFISDIDATTVKALGILNEKYQPGDDAYGIPHPGVLIVNPNMEVVGKIYVEGFKTRVDAQSVLATAIELLN